MPAQDQQPSIGEPTPNFVNLAPSDVYGNITVTSASSVPDPLRDIPKKSLEQKHLKFGLEIELFLPKENSPGFETELKKLGCDIGGDCSINPPSPIADWKAYEIRTKPFYFDDFLVEFPKIGEVLEKYGAKANSSCGLHVHASHYRFFFAKYLKRIYTTWLAMENVFYSMQPKTRLYASYAVRKEYTELLHGKPQFRTGGRGHLGGRDALYIGALTSSHRTIECRLHAGSTDGEAIMAWVKLLNLFYLYCFKAYLPKEILALAKMPCSREKANKVWEILRVDGPYKLYYNKRLNSTLFPLFSEPQKSREEIIKLTSKIKWFKSRYKIDKITNQDASHLLSPVNFVYTSPANKYEDKYLQLEKSKYLMRRDISKLYMRPGEDI